MNDGGDPADRGLSVEQVGKMLGVSRTKVYSLIGAGKLSHVKIGSRTVVSLNSAKAILAGSAHQQVARKCIAANVAYGAREAAFLRQMMRADKATPPQQQWLDKIAARLT